MKSIFIALMFFTAIQAQAKTQSWSVQSAQQILGKDKSGQAVEIDLAIDNDSAADGIWHIYTSGADNGGETEFSVVPTHTRLPNGGDKWIFKSHGVGSNHSDERFTYILTQNLSSGGHLLLTMPSGFVTEMRASGILLEN
jgi:hypothetical protein